MEKELFGVPFFVWGGICLLIGVIWLFVWPKDKGSVSVNQPLLYEGLGDINDNFGS